MQDLASTGMLVCAALAALALGVSLGYGTCKAFFSALRSQVRAVETKRVEPGIASTIAS